MNVKVDQGASNMQKVVVKKVSARTVFKLIFVGLNVSLILWGVIYGLLALFGFSVLKVNGQFVVGIEGLFAGPLIGIMVALLASIFSGVFSVMGLWIFSKFRPLQIEFESVVCGEDELKRSNHVQQ